MGTITISANGMRTIPGSDEQVTFFTLTAGDTTYKWHANTPRLEGEALDAYLSARKEAYLCGIYRKMYMGADVIPAEAETELEAWTRWIGAGCKNIRQVEAGTVEEAVPLAPWKDTHGTATETPVTWIT